MQFDRQIEDVVDTIAIGSVDRIDQDLVAPHPTEVAASAGRENGAVRLHPRTIKTSTLIRMGVAIRRTDLRVGIEKDDNCDTFFFLII